MSAAVAIPARLGSSRLPRKVLAEIAGRPMLWHVWSRCCQAFPPRQVYILTDAAEVLRAAQAWTPLVLMTSTKCRSGTERIASALDHMAGDTIIHVQADEPMIDPRLLRQLAAVSAQRGCVVTPVYRIRDLDTLADPHTVKVVRDRDGKALYFSRAAIPYCRDVPHSLWADRHAYFGHLGVYAYPRELLRQYSALPDGRLEQSERLEQLRLLEAGIPIHTIQTHCRSVGVDTPADLARVRTLMQADQDPDPPRDAGK